MNDELNIPLLDDLVSKGQDDAEHESEQLSFDENSNLQIEDEAPESNEAMTSDYASTPSEDELTEDASIKELLIDEEIRMILDKHMDKAYEEIIRLLNHKIS